MPPTRTIINDKKTLGGVNSKISKHYNKEIYLEENESLPEEIKKAIYAGNVIIGMTRGQVTASRGSPYKINKTTSASEVYEQWIMYTSSGPDHGSRKDKEYGYIYFKNGKVTGWQSW
jgi:hypothetical protein